MSMDIEDLNKSQIILLTLLVSFVTSIATGIVTVSLMEKAPKDVVRVTQKVVERVVEKVEQANPIKKEEPVKEKIIEKTVVVKEGDIMAQSIAENRNKLLSIYDSDTGEFLAYAFPASANTLLTDVSIYSDTANYIAKNSNGDKYTIEYLRGGGARKLALFKIVNTDKKLRALKILDGTPSLGQSVFLFVSPDLNRVSQSIISFFKDSLVYADVKKEEVYPGTMIFNSKGELIGISTEASREIEDAAFVGPVSIQAFLKADKQGSDSQNADVGESAEKDNNPNASSTSAANNTTDNKQNSTQEAAVSSITR